MAAGHQRVTCRRCAGPLSIPRGSSHRLVPASLSWRLRWSMGLGNRLTSEKGKDIVMSMSDAFAMLGCSIHAG
jgi:hypothetical protein